LEPAQEDDPFVALQAYVRSRLPLLRSRNIALQCSAAALVRVSRLLGAITVATETHLEDTAGVLIRSLCETWAVGLFCLWGGRAAVVRLAPAAADQYEKQRKEFVAVEGFFGISPLPPEEHARYDHRIAVFKTLASEGAPLNKKGEYITLKARDLFTTELRELFKANDPGLANLGQIAYSNVYCTESALSTHGGLLSLEPYIAPADEGEYRVVELPQRGYLDNAPMRVAGVLCAYLAGKVFRRFGIDTDARVEAAFSVSSPAPPELPG
jgi:hypothetical protein